MVSVIIVDYRSIIKTCDFIEHFSMQATPSDLYHYIIIDNYIDSNGVDILRNRYACEPFVQNIFNDKFYLYKTCYGEIVYFSSKKNLGYAKANNIGTKLADFVYNDEYYIICNNDLRLSRSFDFNNFEKIFDSDPSISVIGPRIVGIDNEPQSPCKKKSPFYHLITYQWSRFRPFCSKGDLIEINSSCYCYRVIGCFMLIKAKPFIEVGRFDEKTFMYGEEMILSEKMLMNNYKCYFYNDYVVIHEHGATVKKYTNTLKTDKWLYDSLYYYCVEYRKISFFLKVLAYINRLLNVSFICFKEIVKRVILFKNNNKNL